MPLPIYGIPPVLIKLKAEGKLDDMLLRTKENTNPGLQSTKDTDLANHIECRCTSDDAVSKQGSCAEKCIEG